MKYKFLCIEGNIGAGKTTLAHILAEKLNAKLILEEFADNPFLPMFYENMAQYAFPLELFFMAERYQQIQEFAQTPDLFHSVTISDYMFNKSLLFAKNNLREQEYLLYKKLFEIINPQLPAPDLLIYLHAPLSKLRENIEKRNRPYEQSIADGYLLDLQQTYVQFIRQSQVKTLFVDVSNVNFLTQPQHVDRLLDALERDYEPGPNYLILD